MKKLLITILLALLPLATGCSASHKQKKTKAYHQKAMYFDGAIFVEIHRSSKTMDYLSFTLYHTGEYKISFAHDRCKHFVLPSDVTLVTNTLQREYLIEQNSLPHNLTVIIEHNGVSETKYFR